MGINKQIFRSFISCTAALVVIICFCGCKGGSAENAGIKTRDVMSAGTVTVLPLESRGNSFKDKYGEWDRWVYAHIGDEPVAFEDGKKPENWRVLATRVSSEGYLVPMSEKTRLRHESLKAGTRSYWDSYPYTIQAKGVMDPKLYQSFIDATEDVRATYYPPIPNWLVDNPPAGARLMPNGDVLAIGMLGSGKDPKSDGCCGGNGLGYFRYDRTGELISSTTQHWFHLYFDVAKDWPQGVLHERTDGYVYFTADQESPEVLSVWDWDGTPILEGLPSFRDSHNFMALGSKSLMSLYAAQNRLLKAKSSN